MESELLVAIGFLEGDGIEGGIAGFGDDARKIGEAVGRHISGGDDVEAEGVGGIAVEQRGDRDAEVLPEVAVDAEEDGDRQGRVPLSLLAENEMTAVTPV